MASGAMTVNRNRLIELLQSAPARAERERLELELANSYGPAVLGDVLDRLIDDAETTTAADEAQLRDAIKAEEERVMNLIHSDETCEAGWGA